MTYLSDPFIRRPIGTSLLAIAIALAGVVAYIVLPVASLPKTEFPTISVQASLPGANPAVMASAVATPLERQFSRIAGINEMTSASAIGTTSITLQFDLDRSLNGAARDVQAAINAARSQLPTDLPAAPSLHKVNPTEPSILILVLDSDEVPLPQLYDLADSVLAQKISQVQGVSQVSLNGTTKPGVRIEVNPLALNAYGMGFEHLRENLASQSAFKPKGSVHDNFQQWTLAAKDQLTRAAEYVSLIIGSHNGAALRLQDLATVTDSVEDVRTGGWVNGKHAIQIIVNKAPGENTIATVDRIIALLPQLRSALPPHVRLYSMMDRTTTIRASIKDITGTLLLSIGLVMLVVFAFLREGRSALVPSISVPVSLLGTFAVMQLLGLTLDNLSLLALTVATGFVVDDAIVVIENVDRHLREGMPLKRAALQGAGEMGFTVLAMSISLVSAFIPLLLMGGIVGRLFREFALVLAIAVGFSLIVSLTLTPVLCSNMLRPYHRRKRHGWQIFGDRAESWVEAVYASGIRWVLRHENLMIAVTAGTFVLTIFLYIVIPKNFFPQQDTGRITGQIRGPQNISYDKISEKAAAVQEIVLRDPAVLAVSSFFGSGSIGSAPNISSLFIVLKDIHARGGVSSGEVMRRLTPKLNEVVGVAVAMQEQQELNIGTRSSAAQFQYTLSSGNLDLLNEWAPKMTAKMRQIVALRDVTSDQLTGGLTTQLTIDRDTASRLGITASDLDATLYDAFGQRQIATYYGGSNQYHVVMEASPEFQTGPESLANVYVRGSGNTPVPLATFSRLEIRKTPLLINHQGQIPAVTISFNLALGHSLDEAADLVEQTAQQIGMPEEIHGGFAGTAQVFQESLRSQPRLILLAVLTIYLVLGILYENLVYPLAILATLPAAGLGALLALLVSQEQFSVVAMIGVVLLIGIVQKNSIMLIDFALTAERRDGLTPEQAIYRACRLRFKPIVMTTSTALLGALPLALGSGVGFELRRPLGISIVGGLAVSLALILFTSPVLYLLFSKMDRWSKTRRHHDAAEISGPDL